MIDKIKWLFAVLVWYRHNLHMLHWKVVGKDFDTIHSMLDDYVSKFNTFIDEIAEMLLSMGSNPLTMSEITSMLSSSDCRILTVESDSDYKSKEVFNAIDMMFGELWIIYNDISKDCPSDCVSKLDEHRYWLRVECQYKNRRRIDD